MLDLGPGGGDRALEQLDNAGTWPLSRQVPAELLRQVLLDPELRPDPRGLTLRGAQVHGRLDLELAELPCRLAVVASSFTHVLTLKDALLPALNLRGTHLPGLDLSGARVTRDVSLKEICSTGKVSMLGTHVQGELALQGATLTNVDGTVLSVNGARIDGGAFLHALTCIGGLDAVGVHISGALVLQDATLTNESGTALSLDEARIDGGAYLDKLTVRGQLRAPGMQVTGAFGLHGAELINSGGVALNLDGARVDGGAYLDQLTTIGEVSAINVKITGALRLRQVELVNENSIALNLDGAQVDGGAYLDRSTALGKVTATNAHFLGGLNLWQAALTNENAIALDLDGAEVEGSLDLEEMTAVGQVRAQSTRVSRHLVLSSATLTQEDGVALLLSGASVEGAAFLRHLTVVGELRIIGAEIKYELDLDGAVLNNGSGRALTGRILAVGRLFLRDVTMYGELDLSRARIGELAVDDALTLKGIPKPLVASGWQVQDLRGVLRNDRSAARRWLDTAPVFVAQPWHELAQVYDRNGQPADATYLRLHAARRTTQTGRWWTKPPRVIYDALVGYGYRPLLAGAWLLAALLVAFVIVTKHTASFAPVNLAQACQAATAGQIANPVAPPPTGNLTPAFCPTSSSSAAVRTPIPSGHSRCQDLPGYPCLRAGLYALDTVLPPTVTTGQGASWRPTVAWIAYTLTLLKAFGWLLTALLLAGVTGLLRKT